MRTTLDNGWWELEEGAGPVVAVSLHSGHAVCPAMAPLLALSAEERLREEDPFTDFWTTISPTRAMGCHSRFGFDLNRPRDQSIYLLPEHSWGIRVWEDIPDEEILKESLHRYDRFYEQMHAVLSRKAARYSYFVVFDLHSYNHRRDGPDTAPAPAEFNPEINLGTGSLDRARWGNVVDRFLELARHWTVQGRALDVRENIRFQGGEFPKWVNASFPNSGCALAIEVKKFFMDEWTGQPDLNLLEELRKFLEAAAAEVTDELQKNLGRSA